VADLVGHPTAVWAVKVSPDGKLAATAGYDGLVKIWDLAGRKLARDLAKRKGWVRSLAFSPDGSRLATGSADYMARLWDARTAQSLIEFKGHTGYVGPVALTGFVAAFAVRGAPGPPKTRQ
jgi:WD40 repeat protein